MRLPLTGSRCSALAVVVAVLSASGTAVAIDPVQDAVSTGYNYYSGGDLTVQGPAIIIKKDLADKMNVKAGYRVDMISSASIDVVTQASVHRYSENRREYSLGMGLPKGDSSLDLDFTNSHESDYESNTLSVGLAYDFFEKNTTLNLKVSRSWDRVGKNNDPSFGREDFDRTIYSAGIAQTVTSRWLVQFNYELTADAGFINNPYRSALTDDGGWIPENYPDARTGQAWVVRTAYGLPPLIDGRNDGPPGSLPATIQVDYRYYQDTFDLRAHTGRVILQRYLTQTLLLGISYQYHIQGAASFYGDTVSPDQQYVSRDKELSRFSDHGIGVSIKFKPKHLSWKSIRQPYVQFVYNYYRFRYDNFSDPRTGELYSFRADVFHASLGFLY
jgi:hypothetical protein